jgi:pyruvate-formate lyase-activating enzyme
LSNVPKMVYADTSGQVYDHPRLKMAVWDGHQIRLPNEDELVPLPDGSDLFLLPQRLPLGFSGKKNHLIEYDGTDEGGSVAVSAFLAPAYLRLTHPAVRTLDKAPTLPLFAYSPVGWADGVFWTTAVRIDPERRQDPGLFDLTKVRSGVDRDLTKMPENRLLKQLRKCALEYGCRAAQNFFLKRWECPLPTARSCNASCLGCISWQDGEIPVTQERISFTPTAEEIAQVAGTHFSRVEDAVASFGQGCEGEPLTRPSLLVDAVKLIRKEHAKPTVNLNTNASVPEAVEQLALAGLSSMRVSMASPSPELYNAYHRPADYDFNDVLRSIKVAKDNGLFVSLNLLVFPGLTDRATETDALGRLVDDFGIDMIQWRNLNVDPEFYLDHMPGAEQGIGILKLISDVSALHPTLKHGYFNPPTG